MNKLMRYFLFSSLVLSAMFLVSCEEDPDIPSPFDISIGTADGDIGEGETLIAAPGSQVRIGVSTGVGGDEDVTVVTDNSTVVEVPSNNTVASGDSITVDISSTANLGDEATLTFSSGAESRQLVVEVGYQTVVDAAMATANLSTLVAALEAANLVNTLDDPDASYTVFAPTDEAFDDLIAALNTTEEDLLARDDLEDILLYHVVEGEFLSDDLSNGDEVATLNPSDFSLVVTIDDTEVQINGATVVTPNVQTGNGVVHIIDEVLLPREVEVYETVLLNAPVGSGSGQRTSDTFFDSSTGGVYSVDDVVGGVDGISSANIDFGYYYGTNNLASLAAPSAYPTTVYNLGADGANWNTLNATTFRPVNNLTLDDFNAIGPADASRLVQEYEIATEDATNQINQLSAGELYAFRTVDNRYGILRVDEIVDGDNDGEFTGIEDGIELQVKVTN